MTTTEVKKSTDAIQKTTNRLLKEGPQACRKFLIDAGIIKSKKKRKKPTNP
jgi:hypothetical protein